MNCNREDIVPIAAVINPATKWLVCERMLVAAFAAGMLLLRKHMHSNVIILNLRIQD